MSDRTTKPPATRTLSKIMIDFEDSLHRDTAYYSLLHCGFRAASFPGCGLTIEVQEGDNAIAILEILKAAIEQDIDRLRAIEDQIRASAAGDS